MINPLIGMPQGAEWLYILLIVIVVFGAAKLPDLARSSGQALKIFKDETKGLRDDDKDTTAGGTTATLPSTPELPAQRAEEAPAAPVTPEQQHGNNA